MPTPVLYMENLADTTKGKAKAADGAAERKKKKEKEDTRKQTLQEKRSPPAATPTPNQPRRPSEAAPQRACALAAARLRAVAEGRPAWALAAARLRAAAARLRAVAEGHHGHGVAGTPRRHAGRRAFWRTAMGATLSVGVSNWWPGRVLACFARRAKLNMVLGFQHGQPQCQ